MSVELGKYAGYVLASYGVSLLLLAGLVWISIARSKRAKADLAKVEARTKPNG